MTWSRFSLAGPVGASLSPDAVRYGPGLPHEDALRLLGPLAGHRVLELGCGAGSVSVALALAGAKVIAIDESADSLARTRELAARHGVKVEAHQGSLAEFAFVRADTVDATVSVYGLAAVDDIDRVFRQVHRVLRPERPFVMSLPHPAFHLLDPGDEEPQVRRRWWDDRPVPWSSAGTPGVEPDRPRTFAGLFTSLGRANFRVDAVAEPVPDEATAGDSWCPSMAWAPPTLILRARKQGL